MSLWHADDWDAEITAEIRDGVRAMSEDGRPDPVVALVSPAFEDGRALLASLGHPGIEAGGLVPLLVVPRDRLSELLDSHIRAGLGKVVMGVRLTDPGVIRGVLVLPETVEVHAIAPEQGQAAAWSVCIVDLAGKRLHVSDDGGFTWRSSNLAL